jgi:hypothetical protein
LIALSWEVEAAAPLKPAVPAEPNATLLEPKKVPGFTLVIDHAEKTPTAN